MRRFTAVASAPAWSAVEQFSWPAAQLVLAPLLLHRLGAEQFGIWLMALTGLIAAPLLSQGRSASLMVVLTGATGAQALAILTQVLARIATCTALLIVAATLIAASINLWWVTLAALCALAAGFADADAALGSALKAHHRFKATAWVEVTSRTLQVAASALLVSSGSTAHWPLAFLVGALAVKVAAKALLFRTVCADAIGATPGTVTTIQPLLSRLGAWNAVQVLSGIAFYAFDRFLVAGTLGAATLAAYGICAQYAQFAHSLAAAGAQPLIPWAARAAASPDASVMRRLRRVACAAALVAGALPLLAAALARPALSFWIGPAFAASHTSLAQALCLCFGLLALNVPFINLLLGLRESRYVALLCATSGAALLMMAALRPPSQPVDVVLIKACYAAVSLACVWRFWSRTASSGQAHAGTAQ